MTECAVCHADTETFESWGREICPECAREPVAFTAECERFDCDWSTVKQGTESRRGAVKQAIQREANDHEKSNRIISRDHGHVTEWREVSDS